MNIVRLDRHHVEQKFSLEVVFFKIRTKFIIETLT